MSGFIAATGSASTFLAVTGAAVLGSSAAYVTAVRRFSGKITSSDASELWKAAELMRGEYRDQLAKANERLASVEARLAVAEHENVELANENLLLQRRVDLLERENAALTERITKLQEELRVYTEDEESFRA